MSAMPSLFDEPRGRVTDPGTSHLAAASVAPANGELIRYIRAALERCGPLTHDQIVTEVMWSQPHRWTAGTIVTACARAGLFEWDWEFNERHRKVTVWSLEPSDEVEVSPRAEFL